MPIEGLGLDEALYSTDGAHQILVGEEGTLGIAGGTARVAEGGNVLAGGGRVSMSPGRYDLSSDGLHLGEGNDVQPDLLGHSGGIGDHPINQHDVTEGIVRTVALGLAQMGQLGPAAHHARHAGLVEDKVDGLRAQRVVQGHRRPAEGVDGMLTEDPLHAVLHVQTKQEEVVGVAANKLHGVKAGGDGIDAGYHLDVGAVDEGGGQTPGGNGAEAEAWAEGVDVTPVTKGLVQGETTGTSE